MGEAIVRSLIAARIVLPSAVTIVDRSKQRLKQLARTYHVRTSMDSVRAVCGATIVMLAVKPQDAATACESLHGKIPVKALVVSIMAGISLRTIARWLHHNHVVRSMPNTPAQIQCGMTVWMPTRLVTAVQKKMARSIFSAFGEQLEVRREDLIDAATAISGSGPAYVFAFAEQLIAAARNVGFTATQAQLLVTQTVFGAVQLMKQSGEDPTVLRQRVTSKKGTTAAALAVMEKKNIAALIDQMVHAAYRRAKELSRLY